MFLSIQILLARQKQCQFKVIDMRDENRTSILNNYRPAKDDALNKMHIIKEFSGKTDRSGKLTIYTDGSAYGADVTSDGRSFGGYGFACKSINNFGHSKEFSRYGQIDNTSATEAELYSVLSALKYNNKPSHIEIVSDSAYVITGLKDIWDHVHDFHTRSKNAMESASKSERAEFRNLKIWKAISDCIYQDSNITSLSARWIRSHTLSDEEAKEINPYDFNKIERRYVEDILGNHKADKVSTLGVIKAIQANLLYLNNPDLSLSNKLIPKNIFIKNINASVFSKDEAVRFISTKPAGFFNEDLLKEILPNIVLERVDEARRKIEGGLSHSDAISNLIMNPKIRAFDSLKAECTNSFMQKAAQMSRAESNEQGLSHG